jgi:MFS transporter, YNFM family, putative membrane transport protein
MRVRKEGGAGMTEVPVPVGTTPAPDRQAGTSSSGGSWGGYRAGDPAYRRVMVGLFFVGLGTFSLLYTTQPLLPELARDFSVSEGQSALSVSVATLGLSIALLVAGPLSEVLGRTPLMRWSLIVSSLVGLACAFAPGWNMLLALRFVEGLALGGLPGVAIAYLREEVHHDSHARAAGLYVGGTAIGGLIGRLLGGVLADLGGWRLAAGGVATLGLLSALVAILLLPPSRRFTPAPSSPRSLARTSGRLLRDPVQLALYGIAATAMGSFTAAFNAIGFRLTGAPYHLPLSVSGFVFLVYLVGVLTSPAAGRLAGRVGRRVVVPGAAMVTLVGFLLTMARPLPVVVLGLAVVSGGFFAVHGVSSGWVAARADLASGGIGQAASLYLVSYYLGASVFGGLAGTAWSTGGWTLVAVLCGTLTLGTLALSLFLRTVPVATQPPAATETPDILAAAP